jgi:hypothetical protein
VMNTKAFILLAAVCRWTARIVGTLLVLVCGTIAIGQGMPNPLTQPLMVQLGFLALALIMAGILAGWQWEPSGAIISLAGWCMFAVVAIHSPRGLDWFISALALPGVLYLVSASLRRYQNSRVLA